MNDSPQQTEKNRSGYFFILILLAAAGWFFFKHVQETRRKHKLAVVEAALKEYQETLKRYNLDPKIDAKKYHQVIFRMEREIQELEQQKKALNEKSKPINP